MRLRLFATVFVFFAFALGSANAQQSITLDELRNKKKTLESPQAPDSPMSTVPSNGTEKESIMAEGSYSKVDKPFLFIARDAETYKMLDKMLGDFEPEAIDFTKFAVVAAFSGEKATGGYSVSIKMKDGKCEIVDVKPVHGAIVTDALTMPFSVVRVPLEEEAALDVVVDETWKDRMESYRITSGKFEFTGGFLGRTVKFDVGGMVSTITDGEFITMFFDINETGENAIRRMSEAGSGKIMKGKPVFRRVEGGNLIDRPHPPLEVLMTTEGDRLRLDFSPGKRGYIVNDGFEGRGSVEAEKIPIA